MKIKEKEVKLEKFICEKEKLIQKTKQHKTTEKDYLYEATVIDPEIKKLKNQIKLLTYRLTREKQKKERYTERPKSVCFGGKKNLKHDIEAYRYKHRRRMLICGRRQGKYRNGYQQGSHSACRDRQERESGKDMADTSERKRSMESEENHFPGDSCIKGMIHYRL